MYLKEFEIRWSDIDANGHLANSAYINFMSHTRMAFFTEHGFSLNEMVKHNLGPVMFYENIFYFKESFIGKPIRVSLQLSGLSEHGMFFRFTHNFYNAKGENLATCETLGGFIDLKSRQLCNLPKSLFELAEQFPKSEDFKVLTKEDTRKHGKRPINLS